MNRIFKVIWSEARNAYVVVSELTKRQSKSCSTKKLLATLIAAGVFSMAGMHAPVTAAEPKVGLVDSTHYAAIAVTDKGGNHTANPGSGFTMQTLTVYDQNGNPTEEKRKYYVRNGFTVYIQKQEHVLTGSTDQELVIALVSGELADGGYVMSSTQNIIDPLVNSNNENVTTVLGQSLNGTSLNTYIAAVNGGIDASSDWDYIIQDVNGKWVNVKDDTNTSKLVDVTLGADKNYYYQNKKINIENVYFLKKGNVATPMAFLDSNGGIYTGTVRGLHNEYLMTGQDADGNIYTYWGAKADDDNTLLAKSGITVGQLNKSFDTLEANEQRLADADIKSIKLNEADKTINLIRNDYDGTSVAGGLTLGSGGGDGGEDTYVTIANTDGTIKLPSGSKVVAKDFKDNKLTVLSINGEDYQLSGVDTNTTYTISSNKGDGNVVKKYTITGTDDTTMEFVDTDTRVTSGSIRYSEQEIGEDGAPTSGIKGTLTLGVNDDSSITITGLNDTTLKSGGFDIDVSGEEGESETSRKVFYIEDTAGNRIEIENVANIEDVNVVRDKVEQGFNVSAGSKTHNIKLGETLSFVNGTNTEVSLDDSGAIKIDATDTKNTTVAGKNITVDGTYQADGSIKYTVNTKDDVEFNKVTVGKTTGFNGVVISGSGINMNGQKVTGLAAGTENSDAVNVQQLNNASIKKFTVDSSNKSISLEKNDGTSIVNSISFATKENTGSDTVLTVGDGTKSFDLITGSRVSVAKNSANRLSSITVNGTSYDINDYQVKAGTYTVNNGSVTLAMQKNGVDINETVVIKGIVTSSEVAASKTEVKAGNNVEVTPTHGTDGHDIYTINAKDTTLDSDNSSKTLAEGGMGFDYKIKDTDENEVTITDIASANKLKVVNSQVETNTSNITTNTNNITTNTKNITNNTQNITENATKIAKGFNVSDGTNTMNFALGDTVNFNGTGAASVSVDENTGAVSINAIETKAGTNIAVKNVDGKYEVSTTDAVVFTSVTANTANIGGIGISNTGITMNNQKITGLKAGTEDSDAVNFGQLKEYATAAGSNTKVLAGNNISVDYNTSNNGENKYTVGLKNNVTLGSDDENGSLVVKSSVGDVLISNGQIIGDKYAITNDGGAIFANGVISAAGDGTFRAANGSFTVFADGTFRAANGSFTVLADGTVDSKMGADGRLLATSQGLSVAKGSSSFGVTGAGISLSWGESALVVDEGGTAIKGGLNVLGSKITNVAAGEADTDAVNVGQLRKAITAGDTHIKSGVYQVGEVSLDEEGNKSQGVSIDVVDGSGNVTGNVKITDVAKASDLGDVFKLDADLKNSESNVTTVVDAVNKLNDKVGNLKYSVVEEGAIDDGDDTTTAIGKLNQALQNVSLEATAHNTVSNAAGDTNITISESTNSDGGTNYALALNKQKINLGNVIIEGEKGSITAKNVTAGKTSIGDAGVQFDGKTYIGENGINANDQNITNVAAGELSETSKDAVNGSQLYATNQQVNQNTANINSLDNRISKLGSRVNKVGAGAAALAALHPMDFDPDDKLSFAVGMGNYAGENAAAIGAFYRPNEKVMMSIGGTYGNNENMVNVGLSFALDRTNNVSNSRTAMAHEIVELRAHVAKQDQQIAQLTALVNKLVGKDAVKGEGVLFPDVPENHWAYEYINGLVQAGVIEGYPDGTFGGERSLTRFEFATMLYKAMLKGTMMNNEIMKEFESEISRIRIDRISGKDNDANKIERVRVNYQNRDSYGTRIAK